MLNAFISSFLLSFIVFFRYFPFFELILGYFLFLFFLLNSFFRIFFELAYCVSASHIIQVLPIDYYLLSNACLLNLIMIGFS